MKSFVLTVFAAVILLSSGCATGPVQQPKPDWVDGDSADYQSTQYLLGRGMAASPEEAKDRARADLAKIFQVQVAVDSEDVQSFKTDSTGTGAGQYEGSASRRITTRTDQIISGIQIVELWHDLATQNIHALAILSRLQAAASLRQQIDELDDATGIYVGQSRNNTDLFLKIAAASRAVDAQQERHGLQKSLQVLDPSGIGTEPKWDSTKLKTDQDELLKRVRLAAQVPVDSPQGLAEIVDGALAKAGFMIETGQQPDFILQARMDLTDLGLQDGWYWQRGTLEITLTEAGSGRVRGTKRWPIKSSAQDRKNSIERALDQANTVLKQELGAAIIAMVGD